MGWLPIICRCCGKNWLQERAGGKCQCGKIVPVALEITVKAGEIQEPEPQNLCPHCGLFTVQPEPKCYQCRNAPAT